MSEHVDGATMQLREAADRIAALRADLTAAREALEAAKSQKPTAWRREWDGDDSDLGQWVYAEEESELDGDRNAWQALYAEPYPEPPPMSREEADARAEEFTQRILAAADSELRERAATAEAALAGVREESKWIRRKLGLPEDCGFTSGDTTLAGTMHNVCHNSHCYLAYVYTYKCNDKQGIIANLTRALLPFAEPPETNKHSGPAEDYDRARDILAKIPAAPPSSGSPAEGA